MDPRLIVIRGNSGSGKTSIVEAIRTAHGRGVAWIEQDHVRRIIFQELDQPDGANIETIRRHATRPKSTAFTAEEMATWFHGQDLLDDPQETVIDQSSSLETTVKRILTETDLLRPKI